MSDKRGKFIIITIVLLIIIFIFYTVIHMSENKKKKAVRISLHCSMELYGKYNVTYDTTFKRDKVDKIVITYADENSYSREGYTSVSNQIDYLCGLKGSTFTYVNNDLIITIDREVFNQNQGDEVLKNMFDEYKKLKVHYEKLGYICMAIA